MQKYTVHFLVALKNTRFYKTNLSFILLKILLYRYNFCCIHSRILTLIFFRSVKKTQNRQISFAADLVAFDEECEHPETLEQLVRYNHTQPQPPSQFWICPWNQCFGSGSFCPDRTFLLSPEQQKIRIHETKNNAIKF